MSMRRIAAWCLLAVAGGAVVFGLAGADGTLLVKQSVRTPIRAYVGATPQQYDTLAVGTDQRIELVNFTFFGDDSAQTPTLNVYFQSLNSKKTYFKIAQAFTANSQVVYVLPTSAGPVVFPKDSTILIYYNLTGATPGTLDTLMAMTTYRVERQ